MAYSLEALLRPAYELRAAAVSGHAVWRGLAGLKIVCYRCEPAAAAQLCRDVRRNPVVGRAPVPGQGITVRVAG